MFPDLAHTRSRSLAIAAAALIALGAPIALGAQDGARFRVSTQVINPGLAPITATVGGGANGSRLMAEGFEPMEYRSSFIATEDAANHVIARPQDISHFGTMREGALDGAEVEILRIERGVFRRVRLDRIAQGGFHAGGWTSELPNQMIVPADRPRMALSWDPWSRRDAPAWFMVRTVHANGGVSAPSAAIRVVRPDRNARAKKKDKGLVRLKRFKDDGKTASLPAPEGLSAKPAPDGGVELSWHPAPGRNVAGYVVYRSENPPEDHAGYFLELEGAEGAPVRAGDMVILRQSFRAPSRRRLYADRVWDAPSSQPVRLRVLDFWPDETEDADWRLAPHDANTLVEEAGETYLELSLKRPMKMQIGDYNHGSVDQNWFETLETRPYQMEVWLRSDRPSTATFRLGGPYQDMIAPAVFKIGPEWRKATAQFTPPRVLKGKEGPGRMVLEFKGPGVFSVDNFRVWRADAPFLGYTPEREALLKASGVAALRTHGFIKTERGTYDLQQLTNPGGVSGGTQGGSTLPQILGVMERAGVDPWLQIEPHFSQAEWQGLVEYLAAPHDPAAADRPWARKRHLQGRDAPWTDAFGRIYFEIGNETWNRMFAPWVFSSMRDGVTGKKYGAAEVYGLYQEHVIGVLRDSPWWKAAGLDDKVRFVIGGWARQGYGRRAAEMSPSSDVMTIAAYNGGWDEDEGPPARTPESYFNVLNQVSQSSIPTATRHAREAARLSRGRDKPLAAGTYEAGPGYAMNGLNGGQVSKAQARAQEEVMKSQAAGVATLDSFLGQAVAGFTLQNFFTFSEGVRWSAYADSSRGGQAYPSWQLTALLNREGLGDMLEVETIAVPGVDLKAGRKREAALDAAQIAVYATRGADRLNLFVLSRRIPDYPRRGDDGCTPVEIELPFAHAGRITLHRMTGPYDAHNLDAEQVRVARVDIAPPAQVSRFRVDAATGAQACGLPPASAFLYVFEGLEGAGR